MRTCVHFSRSLLSNSWWQTMVGCQVLSRPSAAEGGGRRPAFTGPATQPYSATEVDGWQQLSRVSQNRAAVHRFSVPTCLCPVTPRAAAVKDGPLGPPPEAAQSVLDGGEHGVTLAVVGTAAMSVPSAVPPSISVGGTGAPNGGAWVCRRERTTNRSTVREDWSYKGGIYDKV